MIDVRIKIDGVKVRLKGFGIRKMQNLRILQVGLKSVKDRLARGIDAEDKKAKPLSKRYARYKAKVTKRQAVRDMRLTGVFLDNLLPRFADDTQAIAYSKGKLGRGKAAMYRDMINFSESDQRAMSEEAARQFRTAVSEISQSSYRLSTLGARSAEFRRNPSTFARAA